MVNLITVDANDKELFRSEKSKRFRPRNGFQRLKNGDFVKKLGDLRCISDQEKAKEILEEIRKKEEPLKPSNIYNSQNQINRDNPPSSIIVPQKEPKSREWWKNLIIWTGSKAYGHGYETLFNCRLGEKIGILEIDQEDSFRQVQINDYLNSINFWFKSNQTKIPDICIIDAMKDYDSGGYDWE